MYDAWRRATVPRVVVAAFRAAGFVPFEEDGEMHLRIDRSEAKKIRSWGDAPYVAEGMGGAGQKRVPLAKKAPS